LPAFWAAHGESVGRHAHSLESTAWGEIPQAEYHGIVTGPLRSQRQAADPGRDLAFVPGPMLTLRPLEGAEAGIAVAPF
jgi:hypothetical protein